jgi:SAM-dependent methyltransferase
METVQESEEIGGWERWHDWQAQVMQPVIEWYVRATEAAPGRRILDAACGTGIPALALAERVGPDGCVVATDVSLEMLAATRRKAAASGLANVVTREANAAAIGGPDCAYDAVTCKDGLMFCTDIVAALRELRRVLKPGGRYAFSVWDEPSANPAFAKMLGVLAPYVPSPPPSPDAPGPFRLSAPGELERVIRAAGFTDCTVERVAITFRWESAAQHFQSMSDMAGPLERLVVSLAPDARRRLEREFADAFAAYTSATGILVPGLQICASGMR